MNQHQCGQANLWFLISYLFWLVIPNIHFNLYLHTSSLINSMQSDFLNLYLYKQTNIETDLYPIWVVLFVIWTLLGISSLMHSIFNPWSRLVHYPTLLVHARQAIIETNPKSLTHVSFAVCQICLLSHDAMISHNIETISLILFVLLSFAWTRLFPWSSNTTICNFGLHLNTICEISSSLPSRWTFRHLSFTIHKCMQ
jgi:hypothetical protein